MKNLLKKFVKDEQGLELSEYAVMIALICMAVVTVLLTLGPVIAAKFQNLQNTISAS